MRSVPTILKQFAKALWVTVACWLLGHQWQTTRGRGLTWSHCSRCYSYRGDRS